MSKYKDMSIDECEDRIADLEHIIYNIGQCDGINDPSAISAELKRLCNLYDKLVNGRIAYQPSSWRRITLKLGFPRR